MHHHIDPVEPVFEEVLIGLELNPDSPDESQIRRATSAMQLS